MRPDATRATGRFSAEPAVVHVFVMTLGYSRRAWVEGFTNERMEQLITAHENAFEHFGGVCADLLYDRMRTVVIGSLEGRPRWNPQFEAFAAHWGFSAAMSLRERFSPQLGRPRKWPGRVARRHYVGRVTTGVVSDRFSSVPPLAAHGTINPLQSERQVLVALPGCTASKGQDPEKRTSERAFPRKLMREELLELKATQVNVIALGQHLYVRLRDVAVETKIVIHARAAAALRDLAF
jgi:hypothetical protein